MENNKEYYTPEINELFVGYEYEVIMEGNPKTWVKMIVDSPRLDYLLNVKKFADGSVEYSIPDCIRTPYLCKQDIIDLGFTTPAYSDCEGYEYYKFLEDSTEVRIVLNGYEDYSKITIRYDLDLVFEGICKSKNELKKLLKDYLNIPI